MASKNIFNQKGTLAQSVDEFDNVQGEFFVTPCRYNGECGFHFFNLLIK